MYTTLLALVTLACVAFGAVVADDDVDLEKPYGESRMSNALVNATKLLNRHRRALVRDTSKHGVTATERVATLKKHNEYRGQVYPLAANMIYMRWNWELADMAQEWADACIYKHGQPKRDKVPFSPIGQNLWIHTGGHDIENAVQVWYEEMSYFDYNTNKCDTSKVCGHYTQVVWADSREVGCGIAYCEQTKQWGDRQAYYIVCNYGPAGNFVGEKPYKAGTSCSECPKSQPKCVNKLCSEDPPCNTKKCLNGGSVDTATCECKCGGDFEGSSCEKSNVGGNMKTTTDTSKVTSTTDTNTKTSTADPSKVTPTTDHIKVTGTSGGAKVTNADSAVSKTTANDKRRGKFSEMPKFFSFEMSFVLPDRTFDPLLTDWKSELYNELQRTIAALLIENSRTMTVYAVRNVKFTKGSIVVQCELVMSDKATSDDVRQILLTIAANSSMPIAIEKKSISVAAPVEVNSFEDHRIDACASRPCQNGGNCVDLTTRYMCLCPEGYSGDRCETAPGKKNGWPCIGNNCLVQEVEKFRTMINKQPDSTIKIAFIVICAVLVLVLITLVCLVVAKYIAA